MREVFDKKSFKLTSRREDISRRPEVVPALYVERENLENTRYFKGFQVMREGGAFAQAVEICRTVFEDICQSLGYNRAQHNPDYCVTTQSEEDFVMIQEVVTGTNIVYYMMVTVGVIGVMAKVANHLTLRRLLTAASSMSKSTHKLIKLVRAKYEHACMLHDKVENTRVFVEKYIYEYRSFLFRIHTWRQLQLQSVWFAGILAVIGAVFWYATNGICEEVYQYLMVGAGEMIALYVISQLSDEPYKIEAVKNYMVDYLENTSMLRYRKNRSNEREQIDVIRTAGNEAPLQKASSDGSSQVARNDGFAAVAKNGGLSQAVSNNGSTQMALADGPGQEAAPELSINIEGEPRKSVKGGTMNPVFRKAAKGRAAQTELPGEGRSAPRQDEGAENTAGRVVSSQRSYQAEANKKSQTARQGYRGEGDELYRVDRPTYKEEQPSVREEQLRQILEEFLA